MEFIKTYTISVRDSLATIINTRDLVRNKLQTVEFYNLKAVVLDFQDVEFVSRSAMHEILATFRDNRIKVKATNESPEVYNMRNAVTESMRRPVKNTSEPVMWQQPIKDISAALDAMM